MRIIDRSFEDLLEGPDYISVPWSDSQTVRIYNSLRTAAGLTLMMADVIVIEKFLGRKYNPFFDSPYRDLVYNPFSNTESPTYPYAPEPSPRKWARY